MSKSPTNYEEYLRLLKEVLENAKRLQVAGKVILEAHLKNKELNLGPIGQFLIISCVDECGKFLLVKDLYPQKLTEEVLRNAGFYIHSKKIAKIMRHYSEVTGDLRKQAFYRVSSDEAAKLIIQKTRGSSFYVDYRDGEVIKPSFVPTKPFQLLIKLSVDVIELCDEEFKDFKQTPIFKGVK